MDSLSVLDSEVAAWEAEEPTGLVLCTPDKPESWKLDPEQERSLDQTPITEEDILNLNLSAASLEEDEGYNSDDDYESMRSYLKENGLQGCFDTLRSYQVNDHYVHHPIQSPRHA